jgi:hypothetical protein
MHPSKGIYLCGVGFCGTLERCDLNRKQNGDMRIMSTAGTHPSLLSVT